MQRSLYRPDSSNAAQQYGVTPTQRVEIFLGPNIDRSGGELFAGLEGAGFYVERSDYPVLLQMNLQNALLEQTLVARDGQVYRGSFRGVTISHPTMNVPCRLSLILFKTGDFSNEASQPLSRLPLSARIVTNTAALQEIAIYVPPGVRALNSLQFNVVATTITGAIAYARNKNAAQIQAPTNLTKQIQGANVTYNSQFGAAVIASAARAYIATSFVAEFPAPIVLPTETEEVFVSVSGTVMAGGVLVSGYWT